MRLVDDRTQLNATRQIARSQDGVTSGDLVASDEDHHMPDQRPRALSLIPRRVSAVSDNIAGRWDGPIHMREVVE